MRKILVINPNSNETVTNAISAGLDGLRKANDCEILCETLAEGPFGVESQADIDAVVGPLQKIVSTRSDIDAFVIACFSDPGLKACRSISKVPVYGIHESAAFEAVSRANKFGVIALSDASIARHEKYHDELEVQNRRAAERPVNLSVDEGATDDRAFQFLCDAGRNLRDIDGADIIILGCAGLSDHRDELEKYLGIPVIDPSRSAVLRAISEN